jgi:glycosyltransferase involved in cell wall biosynthesis
MAMQKAVVNSNIGWAPELIDDGVNGYLVHPENHDLYAQRFWNCSVTTRCAKPSGAPRGKNRAKFDIQQLVRDNIAFYRQVIKDKK